MIVTWVLGPGLHLAINRLGIFPGGGGLMTDSDGLLAPGGGEDAVAEIFSFEVGDHKSADVGFDVSKGCFGFMLKAAEEGWDDPVLEIRAGEEADDLFAIGGRQVFVAFSHYIQSYAGIHQRYFGFFIFCDADGGV